MMNTDTDTEYFENLRKVEQHEDAIEAAMMAEVAEFHATQDAEKAEAEAANSTHVRAADSVRSLAAAKLAEAEIMEARATEVAARKAAHPDERNPRHPKNKAARIRYAAKGLRRDAETLAAWTVRDEAGFQRYVSEGLGMTDGYFAPIDRIAWKRTLGA